MESLINEFKEILNKEDQLLDKLIEKQSELRKSVTEKNWDALVTNIACLNEISKEFQKIDSRRDEIQIQLKTEELKPSFEQLGKVRSKLLKCKVENRVLGDYVNIAKNFIQEVVEKAVPQRRNKNYTRTGQIVQVQPQSVVLNQLF